MSRRRLALLPVMLALVGGFYLLERGAPEAPVHLVIGPAAPSLRELSLRWRRAGSDHVEREADLRFAAGAPRDLYRGERLARGAWAVAVRERLADGSERTLTRAVSVDGERPAEVDLE